MTIETKGVIELKDLTSIVFECAKCSSKITLPLGNLKKIPLSCPDCEECWLMKDGSEAEDIRKFIRHIERAAKSNEKSFKIRFEIAGLGKPA